MKNMAKDVNNMSKAFTIVNTQLKRLKETDSDLSGSEDEDETSHLHIYGNNFGKVTSNFHCWENNLNPALQVFSTRLTVVTSAYKPISN